MDPRRPEDIKDDIARADEFAPKGSVKHFLLSLGFFPNNEEEARALVKSIIESEERLRGILDDNGIRY